MSANKFLNGPGQASSQELQKQYSELVGLAPLAQTEFESIKKTDGGGECSAKLDIILSILKNIQGYINNNTPPTPQEKAQNPLSRAIVHYFSAPEEEKKFKHLIELGEAFCKWGNHEMSQKEREDFAKSVGIKL